MLLELAILVIVVGIVVWLVLYMRAQKPVTGAQQLIQQHRYEEAIAEADRTIADSPRDAAAFLYRAEASKLLGGFDDAIASYRSVLAIDPDDAAAREGLALSLAHAKRSLDEATRVMEETIASYPQIQEFQALSLAWILLRGGRREEALRLFEDNLVLLQTRFQDDYTDPDPQLAETLWLFAELSRAAGDQGRASALYAKARAWAPGSVFAG
jgi:tetratricopeptide (TPR) repeat protein